MNKIKKSLLRVFGAFIAFVFSYSWASSLVASNLISREPVSHPLYGVEYDYEQKLSLWDRISSVIFTPIAALIISILAISVGIVFYIKRKNSKKNVKKDS